jgi:SAM-dependent methyltransferase
LSAPTMSHDEMPRVARFWNGVAHDFDAIYSGEKGRLGRVLDRWLRKDIYQRFDWVMRRAGDVRGAAVCDIGCGSGRFVTALAGKGAFPVTGLDVAPEMLRLARELAVRDGVEGPCRFVHADVLDWRTDERFDLTLAVGLWDYIVDPVPRLRVIRDLTRGKFLSTWPRRWTWRMPVRKLRLSALGCPVHFFSSHDVERYLRQAGFRVESLDVVGKLYCVEARPA